MLRILKDEIESKHGSRFSGLCNVHIRGEHVRFGRDELMLSSYAQVTSTWKEMTEGFAMGIIKIGSNEAYVHADLTDVFGCSMLRYIHT